MKQAKRERALRWRAITSTTVDDWEGADPKQLPPGAQPKKKVVTQLIDSDGRRWWDEGDGPVLIEGARGRKA